MKKKISVIIPYYNNIKFIFASINSVLNQTYKNLEIILIYDDVNKTDLNLIKKKFKNKIKYIVNDQNLGPAQSRNKGLKASKGYYIAYLDADDFWKKNKLKKQVKFMEKNNLDLSYTSYQIKNDNFKIIHKIKRNYSYNELLKKCDIGLSTVIMKSNLIKLGTFPNLRTQEDYALWLMYLRKGVKIAGLNQVLSIWRNTPNSISKNTFRKVIDAYKVYHRFEKKNLIISIYRVLILSINKMIKLAK